jgi:hypothetical protein
VRSGSHRRFDFGLASVGIPLALERLLSAISVAVSLEHHPCLVLLAVLGSP